MSYVKPKPEERCRFKDVVEKWRGGCHNKARANGFCHVHGGVEPGMTPAQLKIARKLLNLASEEFSNHGCNDFDLIKDGGLTKAEAVEIQTWINTHPDFKNDPIDVQSKWSMDWLLMRMLGEVLINESAARPASPSGTDSPPRATARDTLQVGRYQHFKGKFYLVTMLARCSETEQTLVIYFDGSGQGWVRPFAMFTEEVDWPDGQRRPRFVFSP
jgi:hypothetical protein